jgi:hypothetical protein
MMIRTLLALNELSSETGAALISVLERSERCPQNLKKTIFFLFVTDSEILIS